MIIDVHTHIFPPDIRNDRAGFFEGETAFSGIYKDKNARMAGAIDLIHAMDEDEVDLSVIFGFPWSDEDKARLHNDYILDAQSRFPNRLIGLASFNPLKDWADREAKRALDAGLWGLGELAIYNSGFDENALKRLADLGNLCKSRDLPLLIHVNEPIGHQYPGKAPMTLKMIYELVLALKGIKLILAHWGGGLFFYGLLKREVKEALTDVFFDTAASPYLYQPQVYDLASRIVGPEKILFGSDYPLIIPQRYIKEIEAAGLDHEAERLIKGESAQRLLSKILAARKIT
ncbi:MAG: amidohydrolase family protein [Deltaproteobacteria bacterium]|nr:amidohydrolase family protein [Deltaproteobacteria bacterium]MBW2051385.1 amidohydrolase family protein [Deltaproteobacteria bacterium]MBW2141278.1 amidohydrolase family protein [Deltaproteobacteria bacterium]MBW2322732.1 amidohydrolase family protein [Deltaproteobacteria bacterium]